MVNNKYVGLGVALVTPFKDDLSVDFDALKRLVEFQIDNGADYLVILGTTAETPTLSSQEKNDIVNTVIEVNAHRLPLVLGIGGYNTMDVVETLKSTNLENIDAILSVTPSYNVPTQEGLYQHFKVMVSAVDKPFILYNVPGRTGVNMEPTTTLRLANEFNNIVAIKEASGNIKQIATIIKDAPDGFVVISGDDSLTIPIIALGGVGLISVAANAFPAQMNKIVNMSLESDFAQARDVYYKYKEMIELLFVQGNPSGIKAVMSQLNLVNNKLRLPLVAVSSDVLQRMATALKTIN
ncbi:MAG: 4-hydroxy-tetrahydrodipicolinate synthase [bacterium]